MSSPDPKAGEVNLEALERMSSGISFSEYQRFFDGRADFLKSSNPELVIRSGLIEETTEVVQTDPEDQGELSKEIGDVAFYLTAAGKLRNVSLDDVWKNKADKVGSFQELQSHELIRILNINGVDGEKLDNVVDVSEQLVVDLLRVVDTLNPKTDELWVGFDTKPDMDVVLAQAFLTLKEFAQKNGIRLNDSVRLSLKKIYSRDRNPHVIDRDKAGNMTSSHRDRITLDPRVTKMRVATVLNNVEALL